ncbi:CFI-box-CTERM domain-containing protein [Cellulosimicrobium sp. NPDC055967]|uniref:CFI-box-CTERM domain-containing protein n=1 Tax=Cellulosimicrobium sp. NPDC055967 TaxID=3345670 RepID=UPI0035DBE4A0
MTSPGATRIDPVELVGAESRLFVDTNVFMDTDPRREGGLRSLLERIAPAILQHDRPVIVPTKVIDELTAKSRASTADLDEPGAAATRKAKNALVFLRSAEAAGLVRNDLGDGSNPYADDLFVNLFEAYSPKYAMFLITNDVTLLLRINLLGRSSAHPVRAGSLTPDGLMECEDPRVLYGRGQRKLRRISTALETGEGARKDHLEAASLKSVLLAYGDAFDLSAEEDSRDGRPRTSHGTSSDVPPRPRPAPFAADAAYQGPDEVLPVRHIPSEGDRVCVVSPGNTYECTLLGRLGEGGEGSVYAVSDTHVVKIFDGDHITVHREEKIRLLVGRQLDEPGICFPQAFVTDLDGSFVGYLMPRASGREFSKSLFNPRRFRNEYPGWTKSDLVDVAISFLEKVDYLHSQNILLGDINPKNLLVDANKDVWVIDADSWQLEGYPCPVGTEMFSAPSVIGRRYPDFLRTIEDERFAVATMLFMILITGQFPYARSGSDGDIVRLIKEGSFAFQYKENSNQDQPAGNWRFMWSHLQVGLKGLFWHTFHRDGDRYDDRPTDQEWLAAFRGYRRYLGSPANFDPLSNDVYPTRFKAMSPDTPLYECSGCGASMAGIWSDTTKSYATPSLCLKCKAHQPACADCGRRRSSLKDGRCYDCNQGTCASCGRGIRKQYLVRGRCNACQPIACKGCGLESERSTLSSGRCARCRAADAARRAEQQKRGRTIDPTRLCTRCGKTFITHGNVEWHQTNNKPVPTAHRRDAPACVPVQSRPGTGAPKPSTDGKAGGSGGCFVATAVYGSYDCPEVWVLRRWRDTRLRTTAPGRLFVRCYYRWSPPLVAHVGEKPWFTTPVLHLLNRVVRTLKRSGFGDEPYQDTDPIGSEVRRPGGNPTEGDVRGAAQY